MFFLRNLHIVSCWISSQAFSNPSNVSLMSVFSLKLAERHNVKLLVDCECLVEGQRMIICTRVGGADPDIASTFDMWCREKKIPT
jgi:hypothetical protein